MTFIYNNGNRPLDGYTIKRGIGSGGFGEVYYAVADSGKEVALKLVQRSQQVELRGVRQCLNLKSPHLLQIHDVRTNQRGEHFIIMEYVAGPSLRKTLDDHPDGLPAEEVRRWARGIAAGVDYLHEHGVVHRDLNPSNLFIEDGVVKIGDYGLSKFISSSVRHGHTQSIGTVHYMAPEIGSGQYGRSIDIYAIGIVLFEMLTGKVPFDGESPGEILMKHLTDRPPTERLQAPYRHIVDRALAKKPEDRYATAAAMLADLDPNATPSPAPVGPPPNKPIKAFVLPPASSVTARPTRPPDSSFDLAKLVWVVAIVVTVLWLGAGVRGAVATMFGMLAWLFILAVLGSLVVFVIGWRRIWGRRAQQSARTAPPPPPPRWPTEHTWMDFAGASVLAGILGSILAVFLVLGLMKADIRGVGLVAGTSAVAACLTMMAAKFSAGRRIDPALHRVVSMLIGMGVGAIGFVLAGAGLSPENVPVWGGWRWEDFFHVREFLGDLRADEVIPLVNWIVYFGLVFLAGRFWKMTDPTRERRLQLWSVVAAAAWAMAIGLVWPFPQPLGTGIVIVTALATQASSPWIERPSRRRAFRRSRRHARVNRGH